MIPVIYNDVLAAVSAVSGAAPECRDSVAVALIRQADVAEAYRRSHCAAHPVFGDGSLLASSLRYGRRGDASFQTGEGLSAWICVLNALKAQLDQPDAQLDQPDAQLMQRRAVGSSSSRFGAISSPQSSQ